jgi:hypothetical protein
MSYTWQNWACILSLMLRYQLDKYTAVNDDIVLAHISDLLRGWRYKNRIYIIFSWCPHMCLLIHPQFHGITDFLFMLIEQSCYHSTRRLPSISFNCSLPPDSQTWRHAKYTYRIRVINLAKSLEWQLNVVDVKKLWILNKLLWTTNDRTKTANRPIHQNSQWSR